MTAIRWAGILRSLGHRARITSGYAGEDVDVLVGLHARRSAAAIRAFRKRHPGRPLIVALTGTDLYGDLTSDRGRGPIVRRSLELADRLIVLQAAAIEALPRAVHRKVRVVHQSVSAGSASVRTVRRSRRAGSFDVSLLCHLRPVKDPFRPALAVRRFGPGSRVRVLHAGRAMSPSMASRARAETARNPRYRWLGERSAAACRVLLARSRLMILPSRREGGANVVGEAVVAGVPILATRIAGTVGLLGRHYPGFFPVGDTAALATLIERAEGDPAFYGRLKRAVRRCAPLFRPERERRAWADLLSEIRPNPGLPLTGRARRG